MERRDAVHRAYWHLAAERQLIFERRAVGEPGPWTDDRILGRYRFTNPWRASDRVSQFLIKDVIYDDPDVTPEDLLVRIVLFRLFSKPATWRAIERELGPVRAATLDDRRLPALLEMLQARGPIYTSAFILCANKAYGFDRKYLNHLALVREMVGAGALGVTIARAGRLADVFEALCAYPLIGPFMGYQLAIDINYSELTDFSEDEFTVPGPGAVRGIEKVFPGTAARERAAVVHRMVDEQEETCERYGIAPPTLFGQRRLHAIDCQNLFCELDKYARVRFPELLSNRSRIKATFTPSPEPLDLFYPPKWGVTNLPDAGFATPGALLPAAA
jgi:alpha-glutamyl/putrescinyl thymine pyrophosphorylase clade 1